ncbi:MAG: hypothetical protein LKE46_06420 [Clostridium sp.]|uniref:hypothetical protein n=1 Tax=Clostridium sp. TaxID=1506 RepID=UPI0025C403B1|nr:hypothetical protein [Clostridium sp.]MCH3963892.1 hypothetical protein [Clostridium sp.]MCI1717011.1 hypothetical protein [Clostridium sp.]MCI1801270.1 hypothetical protein [Clostridium sp.]MCI1815116.1 hypothetical protein [Clostridium sp.]MCI1872100.1 hypothetical protein [Clostridium sp.]
MFRKKDEREKSAYAVAVQYSNLIVALLMFCLIIVQSLLGDIVAFYGWHIKIHIDEGIRNGFTFIMSTQIIIIFISQMIINRRFGGESRPIVSGDNKFRFMDEREKVVSAKSIEIGMTYISIYFVIWAVMDIIKYGVIGPAAIMLIFIFIVYMLARFLVLVKLGG